MLVQLPRGSSDQPKALRDDGCDAFEAALRRDLATAPVVSYESVLGGGVKRAADVFVVVLLSPIWLPLMLFAALWSKIRHSAPVFRADERVGYGGRVFQCYGLRIAPPTAVIEHLRPVDAEPANDWGVIASKAETGRAKWRRVFERLPQMFNVLKGEMSLVGPAPLAQADLEPLKTAKRYYLSARPGVVGINSIADADAEDPGHYKLYFMSWSLSADALIMWDALRGIRERGELWKPGAKVKRRPLAEGETPRRRRSAGA